MKSQLYHPCVLCLTVLAMVACAPQLKPIPATSHTDQHRATTTSATNQHPRFRPFNDGNYWVLLDPIPFRIDSTGQHGIVPAGLATNFANVPPIARWICKPYGDHGRAAIVHDYLYWTQPGTRREADVAFYELSKKYGTPRLKRNIMYTLIRWFAAGRWKTSTKERRMGMRWIIPKKDIEHIPGNISWPDYREEMFRKNPARRTAQ